VEWGIIWKRYTVLVIGTYRTDESCTVGKDIWNGYYSICKAYTMELERTESMKITELEWIYGTDIWNGGMEQVDGK
jgi:hypothetical protein